jgi:hypothetical protein
MPKNDVGNGADPPGRRDGDAEAFHNRRQPERDAIEAGHVAKVDQRQGEHPIVVEARQNIAGRHMGASRVLRVETPLKPIAFAGRKPCRISGPICQVKIGHESEQDRGQRLDDEEPLPACKAARPMKAEERRRDWRADRG